MTKNGIHYLFGGFFWLMISIFTCWKSMQIGLGTYQAPGPGFFPFSAGILLAVFSILLMISASRGRTEAKLSDFWEGVRWRRAAMVSASLFIYTILLPEGGYLVTTFGLLVFLFGMAGGSKPYIWVINAFLISLLTHLLFYSWLDVQLPRGLIGF